MALSTQCPHCYTTFRVAHDQLKLRAGLVRCGVCQQVFNASEYLLPSDQPAPGNPPISEPDFVHDAPPDDQFPPALQADDEPPHAQAAIAPPTEEPDFVTRGRRKRRAARIMRIWTTIGTLVLGVIFVAQGGYAFRNQIAAWLPQTRPLLTRACALLACRIDWPAHIDAVSIESSELQLLVPNQNKYVLTVLLRNHSATTQAWPNIEMTLNDANEQPLVRRIFTAQEYVTPAQEVARGFAATSEQSIKLFFEVARIKPAGYRVYLFYS